MTTTVAPPGTASTTPARAPRRARRWGDHLFVVPAVLFVAATVLYPLIFNIDLSFRDVGVAQIVTGGAEWVGWENYTDQLGRDEFWHALMISLLYTVLAVAVAFALGMALAVYFNQRFPGRNIMRSLLLLAWILPTVVSANVWRWMLDGSYGLINTLLEAVGLIDGDVFWLARPVPALFAVVIATAWSFTPFIMILLLAGLQGIPDTLYEAATIDGAGAWRRFTSVTLPLLKPVNLTALLLCFISTFKTFDTVFLMTRGGPGEATMILPIYAYNEAFEFFRFDTGAVATTLMLIVPLGLSVFYFRSLRREELS
ncbi:carbohydrate ABC transporter permease [Jiangella alkaliphila]|uniref:Multiple sugar transport system permease protein n=1 Tax=Jiangella alkaliphila TaxID=419479 RepID=A0A1H2I8V7_9ACTN|nr:sugar ABC transporter permease [Jiangella alkaliphila]SDU40533.1 multiple sugar transport system permease protein [Jiangella alkaliphila]